MRQSTMPRISRRRCRPAVMRIWPPGWSAASNRMTAWPRSPATRAASSPAGPAPTTTTLRRGPVAAGDDMRHRRLAPGGGVVDAGRLAAIDAVDAVAHADAGPDLGLAPLHRPCGRCAGRPCAAGSCRPCRACRSRSRGARWRRPGCGRRGRSAPCVAARTSPAKSRCGAERAPMPGMTCDSASSVSMWPLMTLTKSIRPEATSRRAISSPSALRQAALPVLVADHADADDEVRPDPVADRAQHLEGEAQAVVQAAAILVVALVGGRRPELVDQMAVAFELQPVEPAGLHPLGRRRHRRRRCARCPSPPSPWGRRGAPARAPGRARRPAASPPSTSWCGGRDG